MQKSIAIHNDLLRINTNKMKPTKRLHPFKKYYTLKLNSIELLREQIMRQNKWSRATFYRKMNNNATLTKSEAVIISKLLNVPLSEINNYQKVTNKF